MSALQLEWTKLSDYSAKGTGAAPDGTLFTCTVDGTGDFFLNLPNEEQQYFKLTPGELVIEEEKASELILTLLDRHAKKLAALKESA